MTESTSSNSSSTGQHVLSTHPLNSEPSPSSLISSHFITPVSAAYNRNHGEFKASTSTLTISSEASGVGTSRSFPLDELKKARKEEVVAVLVCAGNRRKEMSEEKETEGLQWGSALANCQFGGPLLSDILAQVDITLEALEALGQADKLHLHFETTQNCEQDDSFSVSLPIKLALDHSRPVLLAYEQNGQPLEQAHGAPIRLVVPGVIGARSVKWLERIVLREYESDGFYQQRDYKILPPEATSETKEEYLKHTPAMMEYPLCAEICEPSDGATVELGTASSSTLTVKGYAMGAHGIPISAVHVTFVPLTPPFSPATTTADSSSIHTSVLASQLHQIRLAASSLPSSSWTSASLVSTMEQAEGGEKKGWKRGEKQWSWTVWSANVPLPERRDQGNETEVALVAYAEDLEGTKQELQTDWNLRGVAEASWSVVRVKLRRGGKAGGA
ncbi:hypothetical protein JCM8547_006574 [Rhodosporidiobolus lusitaniae]